MQLLYSYDIEPIINVNSKYTHSCFQDKANLAELCKVKYRIQ